MSADREVTRIVRSWLHEDAYEDADRILDLVLDEIDTTPQRRSAWSAWRFQDMNRFAQVAAIAAVALAVVVAGFVLTRPDVGTPTPSVSPVPSAAARPAGSILYQLHDPVAGTDSIYALDADGTTRTMVTRPACCIVLAPDGGAFIYGTDLGGGISTAGYQGIPGNGSANQLMSWCAESAGCSPDIAAPGLSVLPGAWSINDDLAFEGSSDSDPSRNGIYLSIDNGGAQVWGTIGRLTTTTGGAHDIPLSFSPDGLKLLFLRERAAGGPSDLFVIGKDGSGLRRLSPDQVSVQQSDEFGAGASWSADGTQVAFAGFDDRSGNGTGSIYVVGVASGTATPIVGPNIYSTSARWSPDGAWIAFDRQGSDSAQHHDLFLVKPDGTGLRSLTDNLTTGVCCAQWSPDGTMLLMQGAVDGSDAVDLWIVAADGSRSTQLTHAPGRYNSYIWSPLGP